MTTGERLPNWSATLTLTLAMEWKQIGILLVAVRYGSLPTTGC